MLRLCSLLGMCACVCVYVIDGWNWTSRGRRDRTKQNRNSFCKRMTATSATTTQHNKKDNATTATILLFIIYTFVSFLLYFSPHKTKKKNNTTIQIFTQNRNAIHTNLFSDHKWWNGIKNRGWEGFFFISFSLNQFGTCWTMLSTYILCMHIFTSLLLVALLNLTLLLLYLLSWLDFFLVVTLLQCTSSCSMQHT